ncbi:MAG: class I SAM-dependent methyltransferase [Phycisphaeraceae bacterium]
MPNYSDVFNARGSLYNQAMAICPTARRTERRLLLDRLDPRPGEVVIDAPAGGGFLAEGLADRGASVICIEPSPRFAEGIGDRFLTHVCPLTAIALEEETADKLGSLAGLHHLADVPGFFREAYRVLKPGGVIAIADVKRQTPVAAFLNGPVDRWCETGHDGRFFDEGEFTAQLAGAGFEAIDERFEQFPWSFHDRTAMREFCHRLFAMTRTTPEQVERELNRLLKTWTDSNGAHMHWSLLYATARKPG